MTSTQWVAAEADATVSSSEPSTPNQETTSNTEHRSDAWKQEYAWVLDHPSDYPVNSAARYDPVGTYHYALVEMTGDTTPELLLMVDSKEFSPIIVFTIGSDGKAVASTDVLIAGASGAGGSRARVEASADGQGLYQVDSHSVQPDAYAKLYKLSGHSIKAVTDSMKFQNADLQPGHHYVTWAPASDRSALNAGKLTYDEATRFGDYIPFPYKADPKPEPAPSPEADIRSEPVVVDEHGNAVFTGVVEAWSTEKAAQGRQTPNGEDPRNIYYVLVFDSPVSVAAGKAGSTVTQESPFARLGFVHHSSSGVLDESKGWEEYVGKRVKVWSPLHHYGYSSDASLPFGSQLGITTEHVEVLD